MKINNNIIAHTDNISRARNKHHVIFSSPTLNHIKLRTYIASSVLEREMSLWKYFSLLAVCLLLGADESAATPDGRGSLAKEAEECCVKVDTSSRQIIDATGEVFYKRL